MHTITGERFEVMKVEGTKIYEEIVNFKFIAYHPIIIAPWIFNY